jgi:hypothetical protein
MVQGPLACFKHSEVVEFTKLRKTFCKHILNPKISSEMGRFHLGDRKGSHHLFGVGFGIFKVRMELF